MLYVNEGLEQATQGDLRVASAPIRVLIADDHAVLREGLRAVVEAHPGFSVVGEADNGHTAWQRACELLPDVILLDITMPIMGGAAAAEHIGRDCPQVKVLVLTMHDERGYVTRMLRAGASGYILKQTASTELVRAIRNVAAGGTYVDPQLAGELLAEPAFRAGKQLIPTTLTAREGEVLRLVAQGYSNKEIAQILELSVKTIETHKANGMAKLGLPSRAALVRFAMSEGWLRETD